jgi:hypothetical protein
MSSNTSDSADQPITEPVRKALLELCAIIPTTVEEVEIVERAGYDGATEEQVSAAFKKLYERMMEQGSRGIKAEKFLTFAKSQMASGSLSMAARKGNKLAADVLAKIESDVTRVLGNQRKTN